MDLKEKLAAYRDGGVYPLHMPGHKRNTDLCSMDDPYGLDITEITGFDDLHAPEGILLEGMERAARVWGSRKAWYLVNGSTAGILSGIAACTKAGGKVLTARNCHRSVYNALILNRLEPVWMMPSVAGGWQFSGSIDPKVVSEYLKKDKISAVVVTSPTYEGVLSDIRGIAEVCHTEGIPLLVDEAHGAHLGFGGFPSGAVAAGADLVVQSLHKTLPAFTQTGLLHLQGDLVDERRVKHFLDIYQSSSPSYILMAGIGECVRQMEEGAAFMADWSAGLEMFYRETAGLKGLRVFREAGGSVFARDPSKLVISTAGCGKTGPALADLLRDRYRFEVEMASADGIIAMTGAGDRPEELRRFAGALSEIDAAWSRETGAEQEAPAFPLCPPETVLPLWQADAMEGRRLPFTEELTGEVSLEFVYAYPPGIPVLAPGERITRGAWQLLESLRRAGIPLRGMEDASSLRVTAAGGRSGEGPSSENP